MSLTLLREKLFHSLEDQLFVASGFSLSRLFPESHFLPSVEDISVSLSLTEGYPSRTREGDQQSSNFKKNRLTISTKLKKVEEVEGIRKRKILDEEILRLTIFGISFPATDKRRKIFQIEPFLKYSPTEWEHEDLFQSSSTLNQAKEDTRRRHHQQSWIPTVRVCEYLTFFFLFFLTPSIYYRFVIIIFPASFLFPFFDSTMFFHDIPHLVTCCYVCVFLVLTISSLSCRFHIHTHFLFSPFIPSSFSASTTFSHLLVMAVCMLCFKSLIPHLVSWLYTLPLCVLSIHFSMMADVFLRVYRELEYFLSLFSKALSPETFSSNGLIPCKNFPCRKARKNIQIQHKQRKSVKDSFRRQLSRWLSLEKERNVLHRKWKIGASVLILMKVSILGLGTSISGSISNSCVVMLSLGLCKNFQFSSPLFFFGFRVEPQSASCLVVSVSCYLVCKRRWKGWNGMETLVSACDFPSRHVTSCSLRRTPISFSFLFMSWELQGRENRAKLWKKRERTCCPDLESERRPSSSLFDYYSLPCLFFSLFSLTSLESFSSHFLLQSSFLCRRSWVYVAGDFSLPSSSFMASCSL